MKIGYARVSSTNQDLELQKQELLNAGCKTIFSESVSAKNNNCLLYTSPSPRDLSTSRMPSSA